MNVNKININQSEPTYSIASNAYDITYENSNVGEKLTNLNEKVDALALGTFYGFFSNSTSLPTNATTLGYAYVGTDNPYEIWNFNGKSWSNSGTSIDMNVDADEEDITRNRDGKLQFKDRASYGNGMGYVILRKDKSFAEQMTKENTIYEIRYDFTLGENVTIPNNCVLKFDGGSINGNNKILTFQNTKIYGCLNSLNNILVKGTLTNKSAMISWFVDYQNAIDFCSSLSVGLCIDANITVNNSLNIPSRFNLFGISKDVTVTANGNINIFNLADQLYYTSIENLILVGGVCGLYKEGSSSVIGCVFRNIRFSNQSNAGIKITDGGFGCNLIEGLIFETSTTTGYDDSYIHITNNWYNNNDIRHCTFLGKSDEGCIHICSSQIDRNSITNCWFEKLYLENNNRGAIDISFNANATNKAYVVREFAIEDNYFEGINIYGSEIRGRAIMFNIAMSGQQTYNYSSCVKKNTFTNLLKGCIVLKGGMFINNIIEGNCGIGEEVAVVINDVASTIITNQNSFFKGVCTETLSSDIYSYEVRPYYNTTYNVFTWKDITDITDKAFKDHEYIESNNLYYNRIINSTPGETHEVTFEPIARSTSIYQVYITPSAYSTSYLAEIMVNFNAKKVELVKESFGAQSGWSYLTNVAYSFVDGDNSGIKIIATGNMAGPGDFTFKLKEISFI